MKLSKIQRDVLKRMAVGVTIYCWGEGDDYRGGHASRGKAPGNTLKALHKREYVENHYDGFAEGRYFRITATGRKALE